MLAWLWRGMLASFNIHRVTHAAFYLAVSIALTLGKAAQLELAQDAVAGLRRRPARTEHAIGRSIRALYHSSITS